MNARIFRHHSADGAGKGLPVNGTTEFLKAKMRMDRINSVTITSNPHTHSDELSQVRNLVSYLGGHTKETMGLLCELTSIRTLSDIDMSSSDLNAASHAEDELKKAFKDPELNHDIKHAAFNKMVEMGRYRFLLEVAVDKENMPDDVRKSALMVANNSIPFGSVDFPTFVETLVDLSTEDSPIGKQAGLLRENLLRHIESAQKQLADKVEV